MKRETLDNKLEHAGKMVQDHLRQARLSMTLAEKWRKRQRRFEKLLAERTARPLGPVRRRIIL